MLRPLKRIVRGPSNSEFTLAAPPARLASASGLEVGHVSLQFSDALLLLAGLGLSRSRFVGRVGRGGLRLLPVLQKLL